MGVDGALGVGEGGAEVHVRLRVCVGGDEYSVGMGEVEIYRYEEASTEPFFKEGVTRGWVVVHQGVGPARAIEVAALADEDGVVIQQNGEWQDVTVTP